MMMLTWFPWLGPLGTVGEPVGWARDLPRVDDFADFDEVRPDNTADAFIYRIPMPGMRRRDVKVEVRDGVVCIRGERARGIISPRVVCSLVRCFTLPSSVDVGALRADWADGVLVITAPKRPEARARRIPIRVTDADAAAGTMNASSAAGPAERSWWSALIDRIQRGYKRLLPHAEVSS
jgi:HSP20 family molecular chaperone IbpA